MFQGRWVCRVGSCAGEIFKGVKVGGVRCTVDHDARQVDVCMDGRKEVMVAGFGSEAYHMSDKQTQLK